jgi:NAD(P)-dependent dehydrogenase (short-subunit alcohol dehydrogenase family)
MIPAGQWGTPAHVADAVAFLAAPQTSFISGEILTIDGGTWISRGTFGFMT